MLYQQINGFKSSLLLKCNIDFYKNKEMYSFESLAAHHKNHVEFSAWFLFFIFFIMYFIKITARSQISESGLFYITFSLRCQKISPEIPLACKFPLW